MNIRQVAISVFIVAGMFMTLLDTTIVDIVLPHMMSAFRAEPDDIQWVVISYMIASAIAMPVVGWLGGKLGHRNTYLLGIFLFTIMSVVCGFAPNLETMILGRTLQGIGEGLAVPMSMALLFELYPPEKRGTAMGLFALGATFGPSIGPTLGGYLAQYLSWRWVFFVNILPGILVLYFLTLLLENKTEKVGKFDFFGLLLLSVTLSSLITALSKGNDWGWKDEKTIILFYLSAVSLIVFLWRETGIENPVVDLSLLKKRFYSVSVATLTLFGMGVYASYFLLPIYLEKLRNFPTLTSGEILFFPAMTTGIVSVIAGYLVDKNFISKKQAILLGTAIFTVGTYLQTGLDLYMSKLQIIGILVPWGVGMGFFFPVLSQISLGSLKDEALRHASSLQNLLRLVGGSVGTAISTHILLSSRDLHFVRLQELSTISKVHLGELALKFGEEKAKFVLGMLFNHHAFWQAFSNAFFFACICGVATFLTAMFVEEEGA